MASRDDIVEVALPSDQNYVCGLLVTAASLAKSADKAVAISFNILDGGIHDDTFTDFEKRVRAIHPNSRFRRLKVNNADFSAFPSWSGNKMAYARLMLPRLLPEVDHVIYCDTDYIWLTDIVPLWLRRDDKIILQSVRDGCDDTIKKEEKWFEEHQLSFHSESYFCTGLLFFNLKLMREEDTLHQAFDFLASHPDVKFADQTTLNALLSSRVNLLPECWQLFSRNLRDEDIKTGCAIHFAGEVPWRKLGLWINTITDSMLIWHRFNARIHGISTWQSLRRWYGAGEIVRRRLLFHVAHISFLRNLFSYLLRLTGRGAYVTHFNVWCRPLKWKWI